MVVKPYGTGESKKDEVREMFDRIAPAYDRLNHLLSFDMDKGWRRRTVGMMAKRNPSSVLDMATGTGDLAIDIARRIPRARVTGVDLAPEMVRLAQKKIAKAGLNDRVTAEVGDGEALNAADDSFDCAAIAFGIRNYQDIPAGLSEFHRVLRQGGEVFILEFSMPHGWFFGPLYRFYFRRILPVVGGWISKDRKAYDYLPGSVDDFPARDKFLRMMEQSGFIECAAHRLMFGVAYIYSGKK